MRLAEREHATMLAGLRHYQQTLASGQDCRQAVGDDLYDIASNGDQFTP